MAASDQLYGFLFGCCAQSNTRRDHPWHVPLKFELSLAPSQSDSVPRRSICDHGNLLDCKPCKASYKNKNIIRVSQ